jgi:hypothetical protein
VSEAPDWRALFAVRDLEEAFTAGPELEPCCRADTTHPIERTIEDGQVGHAPGNSWYPQIADRACGKQLWISRPGNSPRVFLPHSRWITFSLLTGLYLC